MLVFTVTKVVLFIIAIVAATAHASVSNGTSTSFDEYRHNRSTRLLSRSKRVVGGRLAVSGQFPFIVQLIYNSSFHGQNLAGMGTLITRRWVLSGAHYFKFLKPNINVHTKIGFVDLTQQEPGSFLYALTLEDVITHEGFSSSTL
ncbi:unnamed protein product, partial [Meganyctiphanes norvegica]